MGATMSDWAETFADDLALVWMNDYWTYQMLVQIAADSETEYDFGLRCKELYEQMIDSVDKAMEADAWLLDGAKLMVSQVMYNPGARPFDLLAHRLYGDLTQK
jgi:hypothetical protein